MVAVSYKSEPNRDWNKFNLVAPLYCILLRHKFTIKQLRFLMFETNRISGKIGKMRRIVNLEVKKIWNNDFDAWKKLKELFKGFK